MHILITGSNGLLGQKIVAQLLDANISFVATSKGKNRNPDCPEEFYQSLDITDKAQIESICDGQEFTAIINTAAMTNVDACEENEAECRKVNVAAVKNLYEVSEDLGLYFVQVSTDFVFDGENGPYKEEDERNPLSIYATSKRDAEDILINGNYPNWSILRTIIVYGEGNNLSRSNIVLWAKEALKQGNELTIVNDQFRAPTWADDLAWACIQSVKLKAEGIFHISGPETISIYDLVCRIADFYGFDKTVVKPISSNTLNQKAKRPPKTGFDLTKSAKILSYRPLTLEESLQYITN
ncbi:NAD(P)-dependent oxidoreductase [Paracrocinitomix mangrovi]|uniref:SDR family oxidoreductase n=1 Tax=Paracrocinitomix mangrovi TaxID=2862509 RepID=UPI001C8EFE29|nr:NAD(P)-dependent oxidoreductase [Paracrocinitomix mangrovi]UKN01017.1 NAD(P)-dependent oxidoreductase [Paracrocinitomix mangrovi]